jgi:1-acyl-sn-glycerol-3-phosphate acyltransferase
MAESGAGTAARADQGRSQNGGDPQHGRAGGFGRPSLLRRFFDEIQNRLMADLDDRDPDFIREHLPLAWLLASIWFRGEVRGMERIPEDRPVLLVGNHSGGTITPDTVIFTLAFNAYFGVERPFYQLAHNLVLTSPIGPFLRRFGTVAASHENARKALDAGAAVLVYPGGDWEVHRPTWEANRIDFAGRRGFVKLALDADVPIVPLVSVGGQETAIFLTHGQRLARLLRLDKLFRLKVLPINLSLPWIVNVGDLLGHLPLPAKITIQVMEPIDLRERYGPDADRLEIYDEITATMQDQLTALAAERRLPVLG